MRDGVRMMGQGAKIMGKTKKVKIVRGQAPVAYKLTLSFDLEQPEDKGGMHTGGTLTVPIREGAFDRLTRYKKEDVASMLRLLADHVEKGEYGTIDPSLAAALAGGMGAMKATKNGKGKQAQN